jgi:hypothetical protein
MDAGSTPRPTATATKENFPTVRRTVAAPSPGPTATVTRASSATTSPTAREACRIPAALSMAFGRTAVSTMAIAGRGSACRRHRVHRERRRKSGEDL